MSTGDEADSSIQYDTVWVRTINPVPDQITLDFFHLDALGSVRQVTNAFGAGIARHDYGAFGEGPMVFGDSEKQRFLGVERDGETFLDAMGARYYRNVNGRFNAVDPIFSPAAIANPQRWNRYAYALNGPLRFTDRTGLDPEDDLDSGGRLGLPGVDGYHVDVEWLALQQSFNQLATPAALPEGLDALAAYGFIPISQFERLFHGGSGSQLRPPVYLPIYLNPGFVRAAQAAWTKAAGGLIDDEAVFWIVKNSGGIFFPPAPATNERAQATVSVMPNAIGMVHTHPIQRNGFAVAPPRAGDHDSTLARSRLDGGLAVETPLVQRGRHQPTRMRR